MRINKIILAIIASMVALGWSFHALAEIALNNTYTAEEGNPYFAAATVLAVNTPSGLQTAFSAQIVDPDGTLPESIASITVMAPGGNSYTATSADFSAPNNYYHAVSGALVQGEYAFTVTDTEGKSAITYVYFKPGNTIPLPDTTSFQAAGDPSAPNFSWAAVSGYEGNLFYRARIFDEANNIIWTSELLPITAASVPPTGILTSGSSYQWRVEAFDSYHFYASNCRAVSARIPLAINNSRPHFIYALAHKRSDSGVVSLALEAQVADLDGTFPETIASIVVTAPDNATYNLLPSDFDGTSLSYYHKFSGVTPLTGTYTFVVTDINGNSATTYDYLEALDIPVVDQNSMKASGDPLMPVLSWGAPAQMDRPLYFRARIFNDTGTTAIWSSNRIPGTWVQVPSGILQAGVSYKWQVRTEDASNGIHTSNQARTPLVALTTENSRPYFMEAAVYKRHSSEGVFTALDVTLADPDGTIPDSIPSLNVTGPNGFAYSFQPMDLVVANEYFHSVPGSPVPGVYTFTVTDTDNNSSVTHDILMEAGDIPLPNENSFRISGDAAAPSISWSGISGYAGRLFYRLRVRDSQDNEVYRSGRTSFTAQTIPSGFLISGQTYKYRVEAQDHQDWIIYNSRSDSVWMPLSGQEPQQYTASGSYTYAANTLTLNTASSDFVCNGPEAGAEDLFTVIWQSATEVILEEPDGYQMTWDRASGTQGDIVGTWQMVNGLNFYEMILNSDGSFLMKGNIIQCDDDEGSEEFSVWTGISRSMTASGNTDTRILHFHLWAPTGTVTRIQVAGPTKPPDPASYTFTEYYTYLRGDVEVDDFSRDVPITVDPAVGDLYNFTITRADSTTTTLNQTIGEVVLDAPMITSPTGHDLADANLGGTLNISWTAPVAFRADDIMIQGGVCAPGGGEGVSGIVTGATSGTISLPNLTDVTGAYLDIRVHHGDHVFSNTKYDFGICDYTQDSAPPTAPTGLTATPVSPRQIDLSWNPSTDNIGVEGYRIYRGGMEVFTTESTSFSDTDVSAYTDYCYTVKAYDRANNFSDPGNECCVRSLPAFTAYSYHQQDGYFIGSWADDPNQGFTSVAISGPGLEGSLAMSYNTAGGRWEIPSFPIGTALPTEPRTYNFTAAPAAGGDPVTGSVTVSVYVEQFATNLQPTGDVNTEQPTFSWTGIAGATDYTVGLQDAFYNHIWSSPQLGQEGTSALYTGPPLTKGATYTFTVISLIDTDGNPNSSFAEAQFTYTGAKGDVNADNNIDIADAILALQVLSGRDPAGVYLIGDVNADNRIGMQEVIYILQKTAGIRY